jgi:hypothetical protein
LDSKLAFFRASPRMISPKYSGSLRQLLSKTKTANDPERRRKFLREMNRLVAEAERIIGLRS